jgi:hypothetical protein
VPDNTEKETAEQTAARVRQADLRMRESSGQTPQESLAKGFDPRADVSADTRHRESNAQTRQESRAKGFDPRTEVSADARHIVKHLWIIFVLLPVLLGIVAAILIAMEKP